MITVKDLMCSELHTLRPKDTIHKAKQLMLDKQIRHIPILDEDNHFLGLVTKRDILAVSISILADIDISERDELEEGIPVCEIMTTDVIIVKEDTPLGEAARSLLKQKFGCLPVLQDDILIGILTEADFVKLAVYLLEKLEQFEKYKSL
ncbi:MAG: CBS domain-containing protein [Thiomargarita sp.]|nr:CBS domain-containing protein [Thiomargarita sp.]